MILNIRTRKSIQDGRELCVKQLFQRFDILSEESKDIILNLMIKDGIIENKPEWLHESCLISFFKYVMKFKNPEIKFKNYEISKLYEGRAKGRLCDPNRILPSFTYITVDLNMEELNNLISYD